MKYKLLPLIALLSISLFSCFILYRPNEGRELKGSGIIAKDYEQCKLVKIYRCARGFHHVFVSDKNVTLIRHYNQRLKVDSCYFVNKLN